MFYYDTEIMDSKDYNNGRIEGIPESPCWRRIHNDGPGDDF